MVMTAIERAPVASSSRRAEKRRAAASIRSPEGDRLFRYMRAIPVGEMCLTCHGTDVRTDVKAEIARLYPEDKALGFKLGELRGAFSLVQLINE